MNKVKSFLLEKNLGLKSIRIDSYRNANGKSFRNNGTYKIEVFKVIGLNKSFYVFHKITGTPLYSIGDTIDFNEIKEVFLTQSELINYLERNYLNN